MRYATLNPSVEMGCYFQNAVASREFWRFPFMEMELGHEVPFVPAVGTARFMSFVEDDLVDTGGEIRRVRLVKIFARDFDRINGWESHEARDAVARDQGLEILPRSFGPQFEQAYRPFMPLGERLCLGTEPLQRSTLTEDVFLTRWTLLRGSEAVYQQRATDVARLGYAEGFTGLLNDIGTVYGAPPEAYH